MKRTIVSSIVLVFSLVAVAVCGENFSSDLQKNFNVSSGGKLVVTVSGGDIRVRVWDKPQVQMTVHNIGDDVSRVRTEQEGNTVTVEYRSHGWNWNSSRDLQFEFYVPRSFNLDLSTSGGDLAIGGELVGNVELSTSGGDIKIDDVNGKADGKTSGGDITVQEIKGDANLSTAGGDIQVNHAGANLEITTSGGEITIGTVAKDLDASTAGGDIRIDKVGGTLHASTSSGDLTVGNVGGSVSVSTSGGDIKLNSGNGRVRANTSGGDVDVSNVIGSVDVSSSGGTVTVGFTPKGNEGSRVESSGGDVYLYIPTSARATISVDVSGGDDNQIISDFPASFYQRSGGSGPEKAKYLLNGGGQEIYLHTSSGNVYIKKLSSWSR